MVESRSKQAPRLKKFVSMINFVRESITEFKKVQWPTKKQAARLTAIVIGVSLIVGIYVGVLDLGFKELLAQVLK